jgi:hypothetical protein
MVTDGAKRDGVDLDEWVTEALRTYGEGELVKHMPLLMAFLPLKGSCICAGTSQILNGF